MKRALLWVGIADIVVLLIDLAVMGLKLLTGDYEIMAEAVIAIAAWAVLTVWSIAKAYTNRCPHCGKIRTSTGKYCPHCGKEI